MKLRTASEGISFAKRLEAHLGEFYRSIVERWPHVERPIQPFVDATRKNVVAIERTYYGAISDVMEGGFCFELDTDDYRMADAESLPSRLCDAIARAAEAEDALSRFYRDAAEQSRGLMADVPRLLERIAKGRLSRLHALDEVAREEEA